MRFTSVDQAAGAVFTACRLGEPWPPEALDCLLSADSPGPLFAGVVEPLSDAFEPAYCDAYARLFSEVMERSCTGLRAARLLDRYERIRRPGRFRGGDPGTVCVLSRVTLGADIAVTSVLLDAAKRRFPDARILFAGPPKNYELFNADPRIGHLAVPYGRTARLADRLAAGLSLQALLPPDTLVIDPDSRLTQLGLLPVTADPAQHLFFESRSYGGASDPASLTELTARWAAEVLGIDDARSFIRTTAAAPRREPGMIAVSLGVGENPAKRFADPFEQELMTMLAETGRPVLADLGAGGEEAGRVRQAIAAANPRPGLVDVWNGSFASFAASISASALYTGYDSSGQHAAAAFGVPRLTMFAGFPNRRFLARWQPTGSGLSRSVVAQEHSGKAAEEAGAAIRELLAGGGSD